MSLLIDTGLFYAQQDEDASLHDIATRALMETLDSESGRLFTSDHLN